MRVAFWSVFQRVSANHVAPRVTLEADGLVLHAGFAVSCREPEEGLELEPMVNHDLELESCGDLLVLRGYYVDQPFALPSGVGKPPHRGPPDVS